MGDWIEIELRDVLEVVRNGTSITQIGRVTPFPVTRIETISDWKIDYQRVGYIEKADESYKLRNGDILFSNINSVKHIGKLAIYQGLKPLYHGMNLLLLRLNENVSKEYFAYLLTFHKKWFENRASQAVNQASINQTSIKELPLRIPKDKQEQSTIATILTTIDQSIEKTEQLIAKYERIKTGLMQDLLTRGIDEQGNIRSEKTHEFKDSPLGRIPKEWDVERLGSLAIFISGKAWPTKLLTEHGKKIIRISNLHKPDFPYWRYDGKCTDDMIVETGDILFSWAGVASSIDCVQYLGEPALLNQHIYNLKFSDESTKLFSHRYINWFLPSLRREIEGGAGQLHLTKDKIQSIKIPSPEPKELKVINERLEGMYSLINDEVESLQKLKSLKTGLMQDLLTGKVRVDALDLTKLISN